MPELEQDALAVPLWFPSSGTGDGPRSVDPNHLLTPPNPSPGRAEGWLGLAGAWGPRDPAQGTALAHVLASGTLVAIQGQQLHLRHTRLSTRRRGSVSCHCTFLSNKSS